MGYLVSRRDGAHELWLRATIPAVRWGPREAGKIFRTRGDARRALEALPARDRTTCVIVADPG